MIVRLQQHWFCRLFDRHGSILPNILFRLSLNLRMAIAARLILPCYEHLGIRLTTTPFSLLGVAIAVFLGFRNNASYARLTEARPLCGVLLLSERSLLRQIRRAQPKADTARDFAGLLLAFAWSLKHQLRGTDPQADLTRRLPTA